MIRISYSFISILFLILSISCIREYDNSGHSNPRPECDSCSILFIGSSYLNHGGINVVEIFSAFAKNSNKSIFVDGSIISGERIHDHFNNEVTLDKIDSRLWHYIIFQGNSSYISNKEWFPYIIPYLKDFKSYIRNNNQNACMFYMMPWAYLNGLVLLEGDSYTYDEMQLNIYKNTIMTGKSLDIAIAPAGWAWYSARTSGFEQELYLVDFNHQTAAGAFLTAAVFYSSLYSEKAPIIEFEACSIVQQEYLTNLAYEIVNENLALWNIYDK